MSITFKLNIHFKIYSKRYFFVYTQITPFGTIHLQVMTLIRYCLHAHRTFRDNSLTFLHAGYIFRSNSTCLFTMTVNFTREFLLSVKMLAHFLKSSPAVNKKYYQILAVFLPTVKYDLTIIVNNKNCI